MLIDYSKYSKDNKKDVKKGNETKAKAVVDDASKYPAGDLIIYFGSQTGTAEGFARTLMNEAKSKGFNAKTQDLEEFNPETLSKTKLAIFLMATYGEGEPTDNAINFNKWMKNEDNEVESTYLTKLNYTVFGLGNRQYEHFNAMGKSTDKLLETLGGRRMFEYGEGDDDGTLEEDYDNWKALLWPSLLKQYHPDYAAGSIRHNKSLSEFEKFEQKIELSYNIEVLDEKRSARLAANPVNPLALSTKANSSTRYYFTAVDSKVQVNRELRGQYNSQSNGNGISKGNGTSSHSKLPVVTTGADLGSTKHIEIDLSEHNLKYNTADNLACIPQNDVTSVEKLANTQNYDVNKWIQIVPPTTTGDGNTTENELKFPFPTPCSIRDVLSNYVDIHGAPKHATLGYLVPYVTDAQQKTWLLNVLAKENRKHFIETIEGEGKSLYHLLTNELSSCKVPLADFLHIAPPMQPRYYTISSSSSVHPQSVHITVSVTNTPTKSGKIIPGLCSTYLSQLSPLVRCKIFIRPSTFKLPSSLSTPIIMIGPGTGIAPMRALIQEREYQYKQLQMKNNDPSMTPATTMSNVLYFGCKKRTEDYIYADELEVYEKSGVLTKLHLAFSRETSQKCYVQHLIKTDENATNFMKDLELGGYIYVCGATAMGEDVHKTILDVVQTHKQISKEEAEKYVKALQTSGRYIQELWTA